MKNIIFREDHLVENKILIEDLSKKLDWVKDFANTLQFVDISVKTNKDLDISPDSQEYKKDLENLGGLASFILAFVHNALFNNAAAIQRKKPPYLISIKVKVDFIQQRFQFHLYIDDDIFGLVVGSKFKNVTSLIQTLYPISAKTSFINEIRFFPNSRDGFNTEIVK